MDDATRGRESAEGLYSRYDFGEEFVVEESGPWTVDEPGRMRRSVTVSEATGDGDDVETLSFHVTVDPDTGEASDPRAYDSSGAEIGHLPSPGGTRLG